LHEGFLGTVLGLFPISRDTQAKGEYFLLVRFVQAGEGFPIALLGTPHDLHFSYEFGC
jgi:hypothetical protein